MIGTIRKHSTWLWGIIIVATIVSFLWWGAYTGNSGGGRSGTENYGTILGKPISKREFVDAFKESELSFFFRSGSFPDAEAARRGYDAQRETYFRILLLRKAEQQHIHVSLDSTAKAASEMLRGMNAGNPVSLQDFVKQVLTPRGYTAADFQRYLQNEIALQQLIGMAGAGSRLVTPQDATVRWSREYQEFVTKALFLNPADYASGINSSPEAVTQFFTNQMAYYRMPERVIISYVQIPSTNYSDEVAKEFNALTNLTEQLEMAYQSRGGTNFYTEKSAADAKAEILKEEQDRAALAKARAKANEIATLAMAADPVLASHLADVAATNGLKVEISKPFTQNEAPTGLAVGEEFVRAAHALSQTDPIAGPVMGRDAAYVIAFQSRLPSEMPKFEDVKTRVEADHRTYESAMALRAAGFAFESAITNAHASGKGFVEAVTGANGKVVNIPPISLNSTNVPEVETHMNLTQYKQTMFMTREGEISGFLQNNDGSGYIIYVEKKLPVDEGKLALALPEYMKMLRQSRQGEAVNAWISAEAQRDPGFRDIMASLSKDRQSADSPPSK